MPAIVRKWSNEGEQHHNEADDDGWRQENQEVRRRRVRIQALVFLFKKNTLFETETYLAATASSTSHLSFENRALGLFSCLDTVLQGLDLGSKLDIELFALSRAAELVGGALNAGTDRGGSVGVDRCQHDAEVVSVVWEDAKSEKGGVARVGRWHRKAADPSGAELEHEVGKVEVAMRTTNDDWGRSKECKASCK